MWRKVHWIPCRSVATNSCEGGCCDISWNIKRWTKQRNYEITFWCSTKEVNKTNASSNLTSGGRQSSACLRRTEKPPWVLVSDAVRVLQKEWTLALGGSGRGESGPVTSDCWSKEEKKIRQIAKKNQYMNR